MNKFAIVEIIGTGEVTAVDISKYLASKMNIIEECDESRLSEKVDYWDRIYHYKTPDAASEDRLKYHFRNEKRNLDIWSVSNNPAQLKHFRHGNEYKLVN